MLELKIILTPDEIPIGATVTKRTGTKRYTLLDRLVAYDADGAKLEVPTIGDARILMCSRGTAQIVSGGVELVWVADRGTVACWLAGEERS